MKLSMNYFINLFHRNKIKKSVSSDDNKEEIDRENNLLSHLCYLRKNNSNPHKNFEEETKKENNQTHDDFFENLSFFMFFYM